MINREKGKIKKFITTITFSFTIYIDNGQQALNKHQHIF